MFSVRWCSLNLLGELLEGLSGVKGLWHILVGFRDFRLKARLLQLDELVAFRLVYQRHVRAHLRLG